MTAARKLAPEAPPIRVVSLSAEELEAMLARAAEAGARAVLDQRPVEEPNEWLDAHGVAELLHVKPRSVQKYIKRSGLPVHRVGLRLLRYKRGEVMAWLETRGR